MAITQKQIVDFIGTHTRYDDNGTMIFGFNKNGEMQLIADVRGWGAIQNLPQFKNNNTQNTAEDFQDALGKFISDAINEKINSINEN